MSISLGSLHLTGGFLFSVKTDSLVGLFHILLVQDISLAVLGKIAEDHLDESHRPRVAFNLLSRALPMGEGVLRLVVTTSVGLRCRQLVADALNCELVGHHRVLTALWIQPILDVVAVSALVMKPRPAHTLVAPAGHDGRVVALIVFRIGWWGTIYCQQILLGMLTIFGPIQWAFSLLPKWEGAWAKWLIRYLTVHFYGAMLYFVGFYVLLLFDIVLCIQVENLTAITQSETTMAAFLQNAFFSAGYLMAASIVSLKCLNLVPDLAAWMIPEGDTAFSTRNFGEGVAQQAKTTATGMLRGNIM